MSYSALTIRLAADGHRKAPRLRTKVRWVGCRVAVIGILIFCSTASVATGQSSIVDSIRKAWSKPVEPFRVIGNVYYVGASGISAYVITTSDGLILLDTGTTTMFDSITANIRQLGFDPKEIEIILSSHAHWDHVEGHARMKAFTGARVMAVGEDARAIASGVDNSALGGDGWEPAEVDRVLKDGDTVTLGDVTMTAHLTAGHTKGCTTWTTQVRGADSPLQVVFVGGTSINAGVKLLNNQRHPSIADDYRRTFQKLKAIDADVFLAQHPTMYDMSGKRELAKSGAPGNPFIDPDGYRSFVDGEERKYAAQLQSESSGQ